MDQMLDKKDDYSYIFMLLVGVSVKTSKMRPAVYLMSHL